MKKSLSISKTIHRILKKFIKLKKNFKNFTKIIHAFKKIKKKQKNK